MVATAFVVIRGISGGIEKIARILMPALIIMILCIVIYGFTLENSLEGVSFYLVPDFSKFNLSTITGALRQAFFSLSLGMGALVTYGSYVSKRDNIVTSAAWITLTDVGIAFIAGLMIFPLVSFNTGGDMSAEVLEKLNGPGLIFVTLPGVFDNIPGEIGMYVGAFFFLLLSFAALTSTVSLLEVPVAYVVDEFQIRRKKAVVIIAVLIFVVGLPSLLGNGYSEFFSTYFVIPFGSADPGSSDFLSMIAAICDTLLLLGGCLIAVFAAYVWKTGNLNEEISKGFDGFEGSMAQSLINVGVTVVCPLVLFALFILVLYESFLAGLF